jgi:CheY-like chemotaxis protein
LDAVKAFVSNSVDLVLLDYHTPGMNGCLAAARMKDSKPGVPIALISGDEDVPPTDLKSIDCFLSKSETISSFLEKVAHLLRLHLETRRI